MKIIYASRTGNVEAFVDKLGLSDVMKIEDGSEQADEDYVLVTYTDGFGELPAEVEDFLTSNYDRLRGVAASGDKSYGEAYCLAADVIADMYGVPILGKFEFDGTDEDVAEFLVALSRLE